MAASTVRTRATKAAKLHEASHKGSYQLPGGLEASTVEGIPAQTFAQATHSVVEASHAALPEEALPEVEAFRTAHRRHPRVPLEERRNLPAQLCCEALLSRTPVRDHMT